MITRTYGLLKRAAPPADFLPASLVMNSSAVRLHAAVAPQRENGLVRKTREGSCRICLAALRRGPSGVRGEPNQYTRIQECTISTRVKFGYTDQPLDCSSEDRRDGSRRGLHRKADHLFASLLPLFFRHGREGSALLSGGHESSIAVMTASTRGALRAHARRHSHPRPSDGPSSDRTAAPSCRTDAA